MNRFHLHSIVPARIFSLLAGFCFVFAGCWSDSGTTSSSGTAGFRQYRNNTIGVSVLTPEGWKAEVGIDGVYTLTGPGPDRPQIYVMSSPIGNLLGSGAAKNAGLEEFKKHRLGQMTEKDVGPDLEFTIGKTTLAGRPAYELRYSFKPKSLKKALLVREVFTFAGGRIYQIQSYMPAPGDPEVTKVFETMKDSYKILAPQ